MLGDMRLDEECRLFRVDSSGQESDRHVSGAICQTVLVVFAGDRVEIYDADQRLVATLQIHPVLHRPKVVADMQLAGGLNTREYTWHVGQLTPLELGTQDFVRLRLSSSCHGCGDSRRQLSG